MAVVIDYTGNACIYRTGSGTNDNDVVFETGDVSRYRTFTLHSANGAMDVNVSLDGTNYSATVVYLKDLSSASLTTTVALTAAGKVYQLEGCFSKIKVLQNGATAVTTATLVCGQ